MKEIIKKSPILSKYLELKNDLYIKSKENSNLKSINEQLSENNKFITSEKFIIKTTLFRVNEHRYSLICKQLRNKKSEGKKIKVCFFVIYDSTFPTRPLYEKMITDTFFDPFIVVVPDISRGEFHMNFTYKHTFNSLSQKYKNVYKGYDEITKKFVDFSSKMDMVCFSNPYTGLKNKLFEIEYFLDKKVLPFYINYGFFTLKFGREIIKLDFYSYLWKVFVENDYNIAELKKYQALEGKNAIASGYCKMDDLHKQKVISKTKKTIIIAPHHTISDWKALQISNFLKYADFFLRLPTLYPDINFIFRPHPLLIVQLKKEGFWGEEKTNEYFQKMSSYTNVQYSDGGEYFDLFVNSDGIIHDCGSFLAEYLFTEKPTCYILKNKKSIKKWFLPLGEKCLEHCYQAFSEKDILNFVDNIIIKEKDLLKNERIKFVNSYLKINYPNASQFILDYLKKELTS